jgi:hypothetical protein
MNLDGVEVVCVRASVLRFGNHDRLHLRWGGDNGFRSDSIQRE